MKIKNTFALLALVFGVIGFLAWKRQKTLIELSSPINTIPTAPSHSDTSAKEARLTQGIPTTGVTINDRSNDRSSKSSIDQNPATGMRDEHLEFIKNGIEIKFGKVIAAMKLTSAEEKQLRYLLIQRAQATSIANEVSRDNNVTDPVELYKMISIAQTDIDADIVKYFGAERSRTILQMVKASPYLTQVGLTYDPALTKAGAPIEPEQALPLAMLLSDTYGAVSDSERIPTKSNIDPSTGLLPIDEIAIERAASVLTSKQVEVFRQVAAERNRNFIKKNS